MMTGSGRECRPANRGPEKIRALALPGRAIVKTLHRFDVTPNVGRDDFIATAYWQDLIPDELQGVLERAICQLQHPGPYRDKTLKFPVLEHRMEKAGKTGD
jgi:hypothetical protein